MIVLVPVHCLHGAGLCQLCNTCSYVQKLFIPPGIYADGYIVFAFAFVHSYVR